ncbi:MAG: hypothetical protein NXI07_13395 [bacterium]|nr:hypothetical protein [bacterium]
MLIEENPHRVHKYLQAFTKRSPLHRFDERMLDLLDHTTEKVRWSAHYALATCSDERVREIALQRLTPEHIEWGAPRLLQSTYQPGDHEYIESSLFIPDVTETIHDIGFCLLDVFEQQTTPESLGSMLYVYEHGPCMNCRRHAIRVMQTAGVLPDWVKHEAQFDADEGIRELITGSESLPD